MNMHWRYIDRQEPRRALDVSRHHTSGFLFSKADKDGTHVTWTIFLDAEQVIHLAERIFEEFGIMHPTGLKFQKVKEKEKK
ncbi:hypothetical protein LCGC14_1375590 [marine sediment metagenome]|uniref:Uncharacterized protein n=1 Tax=marine sediment metagenome TaxID=412755 RepID=A0A0F9KQ26_9ZZZZ